MTSCSLHSSGEWPRASKRLGGELLGQQGTGRQRLLEPGQDGSSWPCSGHSEPWGPCNSTPGGLGGEAGREGLFVRRKPDTYPRAPCPRGLILAWRAELSSPTQPCSVRALVDARLMGSHSPRVGAASAPRLDRGTMTPPLCSGWGNFSPSPGKGDSLWSEAETQTQGVQSLSLPLSPVWSTACGRGPPVP